MKKNKIIIICLFILFNMNLFAFFPCQYKTCVKEAINQEIEKEIQSLKPAYKKLSLKLSQLERQYKKYLKSLEEQNKLYEKIIALKKRNSLKIKNINFVLNKLILNNNENINENMIRTLENLESLTQDIKRK